ncbi:hypothetical protein L6164_005727 [Bauhinia variegata]|uniref:Uncharacterized protein n=1 Tax=Bauhinia variegata TaxID=167791 RepID=A0ACB9PTN0_BAUVA|nr:hypothetical protein L6164_005727 [Bauhinia variegata]
MARHQKVGEKRLLSISTFVQAARNNVLLAVPAFLYAINNYLKFIMQAVMAEARSQQAASMTEFHWLGHRFPISNAKTRVAILKSW